MAPNQPLVARAMPLLLLAGACSAPPRPQVITGRVALSTFPAPPRELRAMRAGALVVETSLAADGAFQIALPSGSSYHLELIGRAERSVLVFPRHTGEIETGFRVGVARPAYGVGTLRWIGDPKGHGYRFLLSALAPTACAEGVDGSSQDLCVNDEGAGAEPQEGVDEWRAINRCDGAEPDLVAGVLPGGEAADERLIASAAVVADYNLPGLVGCENP